MRCKALLLILLPLILFACSAPKELSDSLSNRGIVPLSYDNPYLGANLFLSQEAQKSLILLEFLRRRGAPHAIEVQQSFNDTLTMSLYYLKSNAEIYTAQLQKSELRYEWVVNGPFTISRSKYLDVRSMLDPNNREPALLLFSRETRLGPTPTPTPTSTPTRVPPKPTPKKKVVVKKPVVVASPSTIVIPTPTVAALDFNFPLNSDQLAIMHSRGYAERTPAGDIVHTVKSPAETPEIIVLWYTGSKQNLAEVLKFNALPEQATLSVGQKLVIPKTLVIQPKEMR